VYISEGTEIPTCTPVLIAALFTALFTIANTKKQARCSSMDEQIKKMYIHNKILFSHKKKEILPFITTWILRALC